jgi:hypothetical protein
LVFGRAHSVHRVGQGWVRDVTDPRPFPATLFDLLSLRAGQILCPCHHLDAWDRGGMTTSMLVFEGTGHMAYLVSLVVITGTVAI